jgi:hypothetical protein
LIGRCRVLAEGSLRTSDIRMESAVYTPAPAPEGIHFA